MTLPVWEVTPYRFEHHSKPVRCLKIKCPRKDCGKVAFVDKTWSEPKYTDEVEGQLPDTTTMITGRACPYCFRAAQVPSDLPGGRGT